jgi:hypothetical protein
MDEELVMSKELKPGRELDALVAEKVMGYKVTDWPTGKEFPITSAIAAGVLSEFQQSRIPSYSTDIAAAWQVVDKMKSLGCFIKVHNCDHRGEWGCWCTHPGRVLSESFAVEDTAPHAICLAALKAVDNS